MKLALPIAVLLVALAPVARGGVIVVDASSPVPVLQAAIDAAADGDILLVLPGASETDEQITITAKSLTLAAWPAGSRIALDRLRIEDLPAEGRVVVRGFNMTPALAYGFGFGFPLPLPAALELADCAGSVWIEDCDATSPNAPTVGWAMGNHGASAEDCADVVMLRCALVAGRGGNQPVGCGAPFGAPGQPGGSGMMIRASTVVLHECLLQGKSGGSANTFGECPVPGDAGHGVHLENASRALVAGCAAIGGEHFTNTGAAGNGMRVSDAASSLAFRLGSVAPGSGGSASAIAAPPGTLTHYLSMPRQVAVSSPLAEGQSGTVTITGNPGDLTALFIAFDGGYLPVPGKFGVFSLGSPFFGPVVLGTNPSGLWNIPFTAAPLTPAALQGQTFLLQLVVHDGAMVTFEGATTFTLVDAAFP